MPSIANEIHRLDITLAAADDISDIKKGYDMRISRRDVAAIPSADVLVVGYLNDMAPAAGVVRLIEKRSDIDDVAQRDGLAIDLLLIDSFTGGASVVRSGGDALD